MPKYKTTFQQSNGALFPPLHVNAMIDRIGVLRTYWRGPGDRCTIRGARLLRMVPNTEQPTWIVETPQKWWDAYFALRHGKPMPVADDAEPGAEKGRLVPGSWDALIARYKLHSDGWKRMKPSTQAGYLPYINRISELLGSCKVAQTEAATIKEFISKVRFGDPNAKDEKKRKPRPGAARMYYTVFGLLYEHARLDVNGLKWVVVNPVRDIEKPTSLNKTGLHTLTQAQIEAARRAYPDYSSDERALLEIGCAWGPRAGDLMQLGFKNIDGGFITFTPEKTEHSTGAEVVLPVKGEHLLAVLAHRSTTDTYFFQQPPKGANQWNRHKLLAFKHEPWDYTRARKTFKAMRGLAGIGDEPTLHSMRKYFATRMANAGASLTDIADALGDTEESARVYVQKRDKRAGSARAFNAGLAA